MEKDSENNLPQIGYLYHYPKLDNPNEKFRLDIYISSIPTEKHFDVIQASFLVKHQTSMMDRLVISHPEEITKKARICAGMVIMKERKGKKEEAFTFGGQLLVEAEEFQTVCSITSSAPIIEITHAVHPNKLFIEEVEILLAEERAAHQDHEVFEARLCEADPFDLYMACTNKLIAKFEKFSHEEEIYLQLLAYLHSQKRRFDEAGLLKSLTPTFEEMFKK